MTEPICIAPMGDHCGEAVTWSVEEQAVYWVDVNRALVHRMDWLSRAVATWQFDRCCTALALTNRPGALLLAIGGDVIVWEPATDTRHEPIYSIESWPEVRLNDGRAGPGGELWIGSMANNVLADGAPGGCDGFRGELGRVASDTAPQIFKSGIGISNTVCFSPDQRHLYFGDSLANRICRYDYDAATRSISNETVFFEGFDRGVPDGSAIDADGYLWNCRYAGGCIVRVAPDGSIDRVIEMPVSNITTCDFGGPDLRTLLISTAALDVVGYERFAGGLFALDTEVGGLPAFKYELA